MEALTTFEIKEQDLELVVSKKTLGSLTTNAKQIKELVEQALPNYDVSNYNESNIDIAKKDKAMLNKASKALNAKRIEIEKEFMKPFGPFKDIVADTVKLISQCSTKIDGVVKDYEEKEKETKLKTIEAYWESKNFTLVSIEKIFNQKWYNKTSKLKDIESEIDGVIAKINDDLVTLEAIGEEVDLLKSLYLDTLNLNNTIQYANTLKANRLKAQAEAEAKNNTPAPVSAAPEPEAVAMPVHTENPVPSSNPVTEELLVRAFKVKGTREQIIALGDFMNANGISFEKLDI